MNKKEKERKMKLILTPNDDVSVRLKNCYITITTNKISFHYTKKGDNGGEYYDIDIENLEGDDSPVASLHSSKFKDGRSYDGVSAYYVNLPTLIEITEKATKSIEEEK